MDSILQTYINKFIFFELKNNPDLPLDEIKKSVVSSVSKMGILENTKKDVEKIVDNEKALLCQRGIVNPFLLSTKYKITPHLFFFNAQAGWFEFLLDQIKKIDIKTSQYTLYGESDLLVIIWCTEAESQVFKKKFDPTYVDVKHASIKATHIFHGYEAKDYNFSSLKVDRALIDSFINKYESNDLEKDLLKKKAILGSAWMQCDGKSQGLSAFIGVITMGHDLVSHSDVLTALMQNELTKKSMVNFYEVDRGSTVFHYFVKVVCQTMAELDKITNYISFIRVGRTKFEGVTFIVAQENEILPTSTKQSLSLVSELPDMSSIEEATFSTLSKLGEGAYSKFNSFDGTRQLIIIRTFREIFDNSTKNVTWDDLREKELHAAISTFGNASMKDSVSLEGSVMELATTVEGYLKYTLRMIADFVFNKNYAKAQKELKLPTRDFRKMTLGKTINAFRQMKVHDDFSFLVDSLDDDHLDRFEKFTDRRNSWAHSAMKSGFSSLYLIDEARMVFIEGIELLRWIGRDILPKLDSSNQVKRPSSNIKTGVFLSYSTVDKKIADRVAASIKAFDFPLWYSDWALKPGDSIVGKISDGLSNSDTLVVLLSESSVASEWVKKEINSALMEQLSGKNIKVIPVVIEDCDIPHILSDTLYVDMRSDFQSGMLDLLKFLKND